VFFVLLLFQGKIAKNSISDLSLKYMVTLHTADAVEASDVVDNLVTNTTLDASTTSAVCCRYFLYLALPVAMFM